MRRGPGRDYLLELAIIGAALILIAAALCVCLLVLEGLYR